MAGGEDRPASGRGPLLYGLVAIIVGVAAAIILGLTFGGGSSPGRASASPPLIAAGSAVPSAIGSSLAPASGPVASPISTDSGLPSATPGPSPTPKATPKPTPKPTPRPTPRPTPAPTPNTNPAFVSVTIPKTEDCTGGTAGTIHIAWKIKNASGVTLAIDGPGIYDSYQGTSGAVDVPFACSHQQLTHTYTLTTTGGSGPAATVKRTVTAAKPQIKTFVLGQPDCTSNNTVGIRFTYEIVAATGVELDYNTNGGVYNTYPGKRSSSNLMIQYDCSKGVQTFVLKTTGGFGPVATKQRIVSPQ